MASKFWHKRYFRIRFSDSSLDTFNDVADAQTKIGFRDVWTTSSPTVTYALADSDMTLVVTYKFDDLDKQTAFKAAVDALYEDSSTPWDEDPVGGYTEHFKTEWLHEDGSVSATSYPMGSTDFS